MGWPCLLNLCQGINDEDCKLVENPWFRRTQAVLEQPSPAALLNRNAVNLPSKYCLHPYISAALNFGQQSFPLQQAAVNSRDL